jgi:heptosyltransferase-2
MKKILVIAPSWVGDSVMAQPLYRRLHELHDALELHVFAPQWTLPLLARMPEVAQAHLNPFGHGSLELWRRWKTARSLSALGFDQAIVLPNSIKSALVPFFAGIPLRTGFIGESRYGLLNDARELEVSLLPMMVQRFCALAEAPGQKLPQPIAHPRLNVNTAHQLATLAKLELDTTRPIAAFCPGAEYGPAKRWPARHFAELARRFDAAGYQVWLFGSNKDSEIGQEIHQLSGKLAINLCGVTALDQAIDLLGLVDIAVCNDSGLMHVAAALGKPLVALYGSSSPDFTPPLSNQAEIVSIALDCSPCFERQCPFGHTNCLEMLEPQRAWSAALKLLPSLQSSQSIKIS